MGLPNSAEEMLFNDEGMRSLSASFSDYASTVSDKDTKLYELKEGISDSWEGSGLADFQTVIGAMRGCLLQIQSYAIDISQYVQGSTDAMSDADYLLSTQFHKDR